MSLKRLQFQYRRKIQDLNDRIEIYKRKKKHALQQDRIFDADIYDADIAEFKKQLDKLQPKIV